MCRRRLARPRPSLVRARHLGPSCSGGVWRAWRLGDAGVVRRRAPRHHRRDGGRARLSPGRRRRSQLGAENARRSRGDRAEIMSLRSFRWLFDRHHRGAASCGRGPLAACLPAAAAGWPASGSATPGSPRSESGRGGRRRARHGEARLRCCAMVTARRRRDTDREGRGGGARVGAGEGDGVRMVPPAQA